MREDIKCHWCNIQISEQEAQRSRQALFEVLKCVYKDLFRIDIEKNREVVSNLISTEFEGRFYCSNPQCVKLEKEIILKS